MAEIPERCLMDARLGASRLLLVAMYRLTPRVELVPSVWARTSSLASMLGSDVRTVQRHLQTLERHGYIRTTGDGWDLAVRADGSRVEWDDGIVALGDNIVASDDNIVASKRQYCRREATGLSPPTLQEPVLEPGSDRLSKSPVAQLTLVEQTPASEKTSASENKSGKCTESQVIERIWSVQHERRVWAFAERGRTGRSAPRRLKLDAQAKRAIRRILVDYTEAEICSALETCAQNAAQSDKSLSYYDGVSNWRPANFARFANASSDLLDARQSTTVPSRGTMLAPCANESADENCKRPADELRSIGAAVLEGMFT